MTTAKKNTESRPSHIDGRGLFACKDFACGEAVENIEGEIVLGESNSKYAMRMSLRRSFVIRNKAKYINHSSDPNVRLDLRRYAVIALKEIRAGDELTSAYESVF